MSIYEHYRQSFNSSRQELLEAKQRIQVLKEQALMQYGEKLRETFSQQLKTAIDRRPQDNVFLIVLYHAKVAIPSARITQEEMLKYLEDTIESLLEKEFQLAKIYYNEDVNNYRVVIKIRQEYILHV